MKIIHVDMDAFYASVEQRDNPELRGRPVVVGGTPDGRGVVAAASYEARRFGIHSALPSSQAVRLCPEAVFVRPRIDRYREVSRQIFGIFREITPLVEGLSLDEAYLDVTTNTLGLPLARDVARIIKGRIRQETGLTASAGVGPSKLIAKIASDLRKPDGLVVVGPAQVADFMAKLPLTKLWGVGPTTAKRLREMGLVTCRDVRGVEVAILEGLLGDFGTHIHRLSYGDDTRAVQPHRDPKSRGAERTFQADVHDVEHLVRVVGEQACTVAASLSKMERSARRVTLKVRYSDFTTITRSRTLPSGTSDPSRIRAVALELLESGTDAGARPVRLIGVSAGALVDGSKPEQLKLPLSDCAGRAAR